MNGERETVETGCSTEKEREREREEINIERGRFLLLLVFERKNYVSSARELNETGI